MPNRLEKETSPYLLQHAGNPVEWYSWGEEALEKAHLEDKPIFLSIGYAACHWCHVMAHESFEDGEIAALLNEHFVSIKVDREERPDLDSIYMNAVVAMTGQGGWPMSVFLTPDGKPFYGGTYFPPQPRYGMPSFRQVLESIIRSWEEEREQVGEIGRQIADHLAKAARPQILPGTLGQKGIDQASQKLIESYDWQNGGWGPAPKFPQPMAIDFLLSQATRGNEEALRTAVHALRAMSRGGMYDLAGGGFHRYSTGNDWLVPHFEKMLYDNAQLASAYLHGYLLTGDDAFRAVTEATLDFIQRELAHPKGGFYSSLDADSEGKEGKYYIWTGQEIREKLEDPTQAELFAAAYGVTPEGNFEGRNILQRRKNNEDLAAQFDLPIESVRSKLEEGLKRLLAARENRVRPATDDKVLVSWNALALIAFAEAGIYLARQDYLTVATRSAEFLLRELFSGGQLLRSWRNGQTRHAGYLEDHAGLILGLIALYQADPNPRWYTAAQNLAREMVEHFSDPESGFFDTRDDAGTLLTRPKDEQDNATPSGNALAALALLKLAELEGQTELRERSIQILGRMQPVAARYPTAFGFWLNAMDFALGPIKQIAVMGNPADPATQELVRMVFAKYDPRRVTAVSDFPPPPGSPMLLADRPLKNGLPTAYVCEGFACLLPVNDPKSLAVQIG